MTNAFDTEILLPYQKRWLEDQAPVKVWEKSRRIGASWCEAADAVLLAAEGRGNYYYMSYNREMTKEFVADCRKWTAAFNHALPEEIEIQTDSANDSLSYELRYASGKIIKALSGKANNFRGKGRPGEVFGIDEAAFVDDFPEALKAALAALVWGGKVRIWSTHDGNDNPFATLVNDVRAGRTSYSLHRTTIDDALGDGLYRRICEIADIEWAQETEDAWRTKLFRQYGDGAEEELMVVPRQSGDIWLNAQMIEQCCDQACRVFRWHAPNKDFALWTTSARQDTIDDWLKQNILPHLSQTSARSYLGVDFARSSDLSVFAICTVEQNLARHFGSIIELRDCPFDQQRQLMTAIIKALPRFAGASFDAGGNGAYLAEAAQQLVGASKAEAVALSEGWYRQHMPPVKAAFEDREIHLPKDEDIVGDLRSVKLLRGIPRVPDQRRTGMDGGKRHGDAAIAIALAYAASRRDVLWSANEFNIISTARRTQRAEIGDWLA